MNDFNHSRLRFFAILLFLLATGLCFADAPTKNKGKPTTPPQLRVLTYNIHHGRGADNKIDLARLAKVIAVVKPDVVALQEVDNKTRRVNGVDQAAALGKLLGMHAAFGKAMNYSGGGYGEAILSRFPLKQVANYPLPASKGHEPRCALSATIHVKGIGDVRFTGTHLDHQGETDRIQQAHEINRILLGIPTDESATKDKHQDGKKREGKKQQGRKSPKTLLPTILVGDLNAEPTSKTMAIFFKHWADTARNSVADTYPADKPRIRIDYILVRENDPWRVIESKVIDEKVASDHRPVLTVLQWTGPLSTTSHAKPDGPSAK